MALDLRRVKKVFAVAVTILLLFIETKGQITGVSQCPITTLASGTSPNTLSGTWYETRRYLTSENVVPSCVTYVFGEPNEDNELSIIISEVYRPSENAAQLEGKLTPNNGLFNSYDVQIPLTTILPRRYDILGFDPNGSWLVLWSCESYANVHFQQALILTNVANPDLTILDPAFAVLAANNIPDWLLTQTDQNEC